MPSFAPFASTQNQPQNQTAGNLSQTPSLFGATTQQSTSNVPSRSLFGSQQPQTNLTGGGLLGSLRDNALHHSLAMGGGFGTSTHLNSSLTAATQRDLAISKLNSAGVSIKEGKSQLEQVQTLVRKWDPNSQDTLLSTHLYNYFEPALAPFVQPEARDDPAKWEEALAKKPGDGYVPVLCRGFRELGQRVEHQARAVINLRMRLHEMNNSLDAVMKKHQLEITVRLDGARKRHVQLAHHTLRLAIKTQVLRSRGYNLDNAEENLQKQLQALGDRISDPALSGREEDVWGRMIALRERSLWLAEESKRLGEQIEQEQKGAVPDDVLERTKRILKDYDAQLSHLYRELGQVSKEFGELEELQKS